MMMIAIEILRFDNITVEYIYREQQSKVYAAQVTLAFEYLHALDILYRDLKPENILIDCSGFLKVKHWANLT